MNKTAGYAGVECPTCNGDGGFVDQICCGRRIADECCGDPDTVRERCDTCGGSGIFNNAAKEASRE